MQDFLRWVLSLKGVTPEPGAELRFELAAFPSGGQALFWLLGIVAALLLVGWVYRRDGKVLTRGQRAVLLGLRALAVLLALLVLLEPNVVAVKKEVRPGHTLVLVDVSQSMAHLDSYRREEVAPLAAAWRSLGVAQPEAARRIELARALFAHQDGVLLRELARKNKVLVYGFDGALLPIAAIEPLAPGEKPEISFDPARLEANGRHSAPGTAVRAALEKSREAQIAGLVLLSDGRRNLGPQGAEIARLLTQRKVPHTLVLGVGDPAEAQYVEVLRIDAPEKVFQRDPFRIGASLSVQGYPPLTLNVKLLAMPPGGGAATVVQTKPVALGGDRKDAHVEFSALKAETAGSTLYAVEIEPPSGEPPVPEKHRKQAQVEVLGEQTRVLLIAGGPTHEYRILRNQLVRDKTVDVACWLQSADKDFPQDGDTKIESLPKDKKELEPYDVFVLLDPDARSLGKDFCELVAKHVLENGAGLWWVCGEKYALDAMRDTAPTHVLAELLPVVPDLPTADQIFLLGRPFPRPWRYELTPEGAAHDLVRLLDDKEQNALLWPRLAGYHVAFPLLRAKPAAVTLVGQGNPALHRAGVPMPLLAAQFVGAGRVLFSGSDETFRWRSRHEAAYDRYWVKGLRWLFEGRLNAGNSRLRIRLSEPKVELGEPVKIVVDAKDERFEPWTATSLDLTVRKEGGRTETVHLAPVEGVPGQYEITIKPVEGGFYRIRPAQSFGREVETTLQIVPAAIEKEGPVDLAELGAIAAASGGQLVATPQDLLAALPRIASATATDVFPTPHSLWDGWPTVVAILSLLALEWWLRKRWNLL